MEKDLEVKGWRALGGTWDKGNGMEWGNGEKERNIVRK